MNKTSVIFLLLLLSLTTVLFVAWERPPKAKAINEESKELLVAISEPCSLTLESVDKSLTNAKGVALIYKVQLNPPSFQELI